MTVPLDLATTLVAIADHGSLDAAAARLHVTAPAVSQRLRTLEGLLGQVLVVRSRPVRLTRAGEVVVGWARQVGHLEADMLGQLGLGEAGPRTVISLAVNADSLATWFIAPLARLSTDLPVTFDLHRDDQDFTARLLESGTVMGAVTSLAAPVPGCRVTALGDMTYRAVASASFASRWFGAGVEADTLCAAPVVDFDRRDDLQTSWLTQMGVDPASPPRHHIPSSADFAAAVTAGLGWGLLPEVHLRDGVTRGDLTALGGPAVTVSLYWQQWKLRSRLLDEVAAHIVTSGPAALR